MCIRDRYWAGNRSKDNTQDLVDLSDTAEEQLAQQTPAPDTAEAATNHVVNEEVTPEAVSYTHLVEHLRVLRAVRQH